MCQAQTLVLNVSICEMNIKKRKTIYNSGFHSRGCYKIDQESVTKNPKLCLLGSIVDNEVVRVYMDVLVGLIRQSLLLMVKTNCRVFLFRLKSRQWALVCTKPSGVSNR